MGYSPAASQPPNDPSLMRSIVSRFCMVLMAVPGGVRPGLGVWLALVVASYGVRVSGVGAYLVQIDRVLGAGQALFPAFSPGSRDLSATGPVVPAVPRDSQLGSGAGVAGQDYRRSWDAVAGLDARMETTAAQGSTVGQSGRSSATGMRTGAAAVAAAMAPAADTPAGVKMLVSNMDERLATMQRQIATTKVQNKLLAMRLRQVLMAYRTVSPLGVRIGGLPGMGGDPGSRTLAGLGRAGGPTQTALRSLTPDIPSVQMATRAGSSLGRLTSESGRREVAAAIIHEALRRGYSPRQTIAILSTALQESDLRPRAVSANRQWESIFQQDASYRNRSNPNAVIEQFFDRLAVKGGPASPDIWKSIFWLQQRPGDASAELAYQDGRRAYLTEIQSKLGLAIELFRHLTS